MEIQLDDDSAWHNRGVAVENLGRYEEAIAALANALEINPNDDNIMKIYSVTDAKAKY